MSVRLVIIDPIDSTENGSVISTEMVLPRRIFILVSGARNIWNRSRNIWTMIHTYYSDLVTGLQKIFKQRVINWTIFLPLESCLFWPKDKSFSGFLVITSMN